MIDMSKLDQKKKEKRESLLTAAFSLFTSKGITDTSVSDIAREAKMAKGTFYLYFKDKYDLRDELIATKANSLLHTAAEVTEKQNFDNLEDMIIFLVDNLLNRLNQDKILLKFISKNLSWGVFDHMIRSEKTVIHGYSFHEAYLALLAESGRKFKNPDLLLFMMIELISSTCYNVILSGQPLPLEEFKPELYGVIIDMIHRQELIA